MYVPQVGRGTARVVLGALRLGVGIQGLLAPRLAAKTFGVPAEPSSFWVTRLFASRELLLAYYLLTAPPDQVRHAAMLGVVVDGIDVASSALELRADRISTYTFVSGGLGAALFCALGVLAQAEAPSDPSDARA